MKSYFTVWPHFDWRLIFNSDRKGRYEWDRWRFFCSVYAKDYSQSFSTKFVDFPPKLLQVALKSYFFVYFYPFLNLSELLWFTSPRLDFISTPAFHSQGVRYPMASSVYVSCDKIQRLESVSFIEEENGTRSLTSQPHCAEKKTHNLPILPQIFFPLYLGAQTHGYPFSIMLVRNNSTNCPFFWCLKDAAIESSPLRSKIMECAYKKVEKRGEKIDKYGLTWLNCQSWWKINDRLI